MPFSILQYEVFRRWVVVFLFWALAGAAALPDTLSGLVVGITDGDTVTLLDARLQQHKVRLAGIDAPERRQPFGERAKQNLAMLAFGRRATVQGATRDRYGRRVGKVIVAGRDVNLRQVEDGLAWHYKAYEREQSAADRSAYASAERAARGRRRGLWSLPGAQPPWQYRRSQATGRDGSVAREGA